MKIAVVGLWHLGEVVSSGLAELGHSVSAFDTDKNRIQNFQRGIPALEEPGIRRLIQKHAAKRRISYEIFSPERAAKHRVIFITFDTPITKKDEPDTRAIEKVTASVARHAKAGTLIVFMSQMPIGTTRRIAKRLRLKKIEAAYVPENLQLGRALESFLHAARTIIGVDSPRAKRMVARVFQALRGAKIFMSIPSAEMVKHALNSFLGTSLSFIYNIADLCEATGADILAVSQALKSDPRIGPGAYLDASLGFSGGTLMRDMRVLEKVSRRFKLPVPVVSGAIRANAGRIARVRLLLRAHFRSLAKQKVAVLGLTYKPGTPTLRASLAVSLVKILQQSGMGVSGSDPMAAPDEVGKLTGMAFERSPYRAAKGVRAVILLTAWPRYRRLNLRKLKRVMRPPYVVIDARNFLADRAGEFKKLGFRYQGIGRGSMDL